MDIYDLESFRAITQTGNFSKAAERLALTQPALSQRIKQLEEELGYPLFVRKKGCQNTELTASGREFADISAQMMALWEKAKAVSAPEPAERLRISVIDSVMTCTIPAVGSSFIKNHPEIDLSISGFHSLEAYRHVEQGNIDIAVVGKFSHAKGTITYPIYSDPWVFICGRDAHYPEVVHPSELDTSYQLLLCNTDVDDWQEYWFSGIGHSKLGINKVSYFNSYLFEDEAWAVLPMSIARFLERSANGVIHKIKDGPPPRIVYVVQSNQVPPQTAKKFALCIYRELQKVPGITLMFSPEETA